MTSDFTTLPHDTLKPNTTFAATTEPPKPVAVNSPAESVMTDFKYVRPITTQADVPIDDALEKMKAAGVRLLFVTDAQDNIAGIVTAADIMGETPIKLGKETRVARADMIVETIMTPQPAVEVIRWRTVVNTQVGHIVATLREMKKRHLLVVRVNDSDESQRVIGMFSISAIAKRLGSDLGVDVSPAHSLAELVQTID